MIDPQLAIKIGLYADAERNRVSEALREERARERNAYLARMDERLVEIEADRLSGRISDLEARQKRREASATAVGSKKVFGRSPRLISLPQPKYLLFTEEEQGLNRETLMGEVYRRVREHFHPRLKALYGPDFELTNRRIRECRRMAVEALKDDDESG